MKPEKSPTAEDIGSRLESSAGNALVLGEIFLNPEYENYLDSKPELKALILEVQSKKDEFERICSQGDLSATQVPKNKEFFDAFMTFTEAAGKLPLPRYPASPRKYPCIGQ